MAQGISGQSPNTPMQEKPYEMKSYGCYRDNSDRALSIRVAGSQNLRSCAQEAINRKSTIFGLQAGNHVHGPICFIYAQGDDYAKHGYASNCRGGTGGSWAMNIYEIRYGGSIDIKPKFAQSNFYDLAF